MIYYRIHFRGVDCVASTPAGLVMRMRELSLDDDAHVAIDNDTLQIIRGPYDAVGLTAERITYNVSTSEPAATDDRKLALELAIADVAAELQSARMAWPPFNSAHEGYAVALEEVDELWEHVKVKQSKRDLDAMRREAIQAAAMFAAFAAECCGEKTGRV